MSTHVGVSIIVVTSSDTTQVSINATTAQQEASTTHKCTLCTEPFHINDVEVVLSCCCASYHAECFNNWFSSTNNPNFSEPRCTSCRALFSLRPFYNAMTCLAVGNVQLAVTAPPGSVKLMHVNVAGDGGLGLNDWEHLQRTRIQRENMALQTEAFRQEWDQALRQLRQKRAAEHAKAAEKRREETKKVDAVPAQAESTIKGGGIMEENEEKKADAAPSEVWRYAPGGGSMAAFRRHVARRAAGASTSSDSSGAERRQPTLSGLQLDSTVSMPSESDREENGETDVTNTTNLPTTTINDATMPDSTHEPAIAALSAVILPKTKPKITIRPATAGTNEVAASLLREPPRHLRMQRETSQRRASPFNSSAYGSGTRLGGASSPPSSSSAASATAAAVTASTNTSPPRWGKTARKAAWFRQQAGSGRVLGEDDANAGAAKKDDGDGARSEGSRSGGEDAFRNEG